MLASIVLPLLAVASTLAPQPAFGLVFGVVCALTLKNPYAAHTKKIATTALMTSVVLLGFGMNLLAVLRAGRDGFLAAAVGITLTLTVGWLLARAFAVPHTTGWLISIGTAICGGSAIAACAPVLGANDEEMAASTGTVFVLNAVALLTFPTVGHALALSDHQFGMLAALAIHDTSSVVGAASAYSKPALDLAVTVKLARALFILPLPLVLMATHKRSGGSRAPKPWFVLLFLTAAALVSALPALRPLGHTLATVGKHGLGLALFAVGLGLSAKTLRAVGPRPLLLGVVLWLLVTAGTLTAVRAGWV